MADADHQLLSEGCSEEEALANSLSTGNQDASDPALAGYPVPVGFTTSGSAGSLSVLFTAGADEPVTVGLVSDVTGLLPTLYSGGTLVTYAVTGGDTLTASANGHTIFTLVVNTDGSWTFTLSDQLDHVTGGDENYALRTSLTDTVGVSAIDFSGILTGTDGTAIS